MDWVAKGSFKGDLEMLDKSGNGVGKIHVAVKFERPGQLCPSEEMLLTVNCTRFISVVVCRDGFETVS